MTKNQRQKVIDHSCVDNFAKAMKNKLDYARDVKGRNGWHDPDVCTIDFLAENLIGHTRKTNSGTFEDIANFCMMLHQRGADPSVIEGKDLYVDTLKKKLKIAVKALEDVERRSRPNPLGNPKWIYEHTVEALKQIDMTE